MKDFVIRTWNALLDRSPDQMMTALATALTLALIASGGLAMGRRKIRDASVLTIGVLLLACLASMILTLGALAQPRPDGPSPTFLLPPPGGFEPGMTLGPMVLEAADSDRDGHLSPAEVASAVSRFVRESDADQDGTIDVADLSGAINRRPPPPPRSRPGPGPHHTPSEEEPGRALADRLLSRADTDGDGRIAPEEAARFVRQADAEGKGYADLDDLSYTLKDHVPLPGSAGPPPPPSS